MRRLQEFSLMCYFQFFSRKTHGFIHTKNNATIFKDKILTKSLFILGYNVAQRKRKAGKVGFPHRLTKEDAMKWFQQKYDGIILNSKK